MKEEKIYLLDDPENCSYKFDIEGWVDRHGRFHGQDKKTAQYSGSTHKRCAECNENIIPKNYAWCKNCGEKKLKEKYDALPKKEWDGETPLVLYNENDVYFYTFDEIQEYCQENNISIDSLLLVWTEPYIYPEIDMYDYKGGLPFDDDLPEELVCLINAFNLSVKEIDSHMYIATNIAVTLHTFI